MAEDGTDTESSGGTDPTSDQTLDATAAADSTTQDPTAAAATTPGKYGHTRDVPPLYRPPGASSALRSFLDMCDTAIQTAVDLLGRQLIKPPPRMDDLLTTVVYTTLGTGTTATGYQTALAAVAARRGELLAGDNQVLEVASTLTDDKDENLAYIKTVSAQLDAGLRSLGSAKLTSAQEISVLSGLGDAVNAIYRRVAQAAAKNADMAGAGNSGSTPTGGQSSTTGATATGSGSGSGDGLGSSLGSMLTMIPMMIAAAIPSITSLIEAEKKKQAKEDNDKKNDKSKNDPAQPGAQAPTDPSGPTPVTPAPADTPQPQPVTPSPGEPAPAIPTPAAPSANSPAATPAGQTPAHPGAPATPTAPVPAR